MSKRYTKDTFSESLDRRLSGFRADPWLVRRVIGAEKGEKPMKKKISAATIVVVVLLVLAMAGAVAAANWTVISRFFGTGWYYNEEAIEEPLKTEYDLKTVRVQATEAYWAEDGVSVVFKVECTDPNCLPYYEEGEHPEQIEYNGESVTQDELRGDKELISCEIWNPGGDSWTWYDYSDDGLFIIATAAQYNTESIQTGSTMKFQCSCWNLQSGEHEDGFITVTLPPLEMQEGYFYGKE